MCWLEGQPIYVLKPGVQIMDVSQLVKGQHFILCSANNRRQRIQVVEGPKPSTAPNITSPIVLIQFDGPQGQVWRRSIHLASIALSPVPNRGWYDSQQWLEVD